MADVRDLELGCPRIGIHGNDPNDLNFRVNWGLRMHWLDILGYVASGTVFVTFWMKTMIPLRIIGIFSNILFFSYGLYGGLLPIAVLHGLLFPLNIIRLNQALGLKRRIHEMVHSEFDVKSLLPFMSECRYPRGSFLFKRGDEARDIFYLSEGRARVIELGVDILPGHLVGEIAMFAPDKRRTQSIECTEDCVLLCITEDKVLQICMEQPEFGLYLAEMVVDRLLANSRDDAARKA